jgi:alpha-beta hydrolase superfamily lysophospholipase
MKKRIIFRWIKITVFAYAAIGITLFYLQEYLLFHPEKLDSSYQYKFTGPFEEMNIAFNENDTMNLVKFLPADSIRKGVVLYYHGNKQNIGRYAKFVSVFTKHGYEVWMEDYPGFGKSTGRRSEKKLYEQAMAVYKLAAGKYHSDSIIIYGKSLGTGIASYVASRTNCKQLILETPYYSIPDLFGCYAFMYPTQQMTTYKIPTNEYLQDVKYPITIFHGTSDGVIPYRCAKKLKSVLKPGDEFVTIEDGTHHNLYGFELYQKKMDSLLNLR